MQIETTYNKTVTVLRLTEESDGLEEWTTHLEDVPCHIQPLEDRYTPDIDGNFAKDSLMLCNPLDILEGDKVLDGEIEYKVVAQETLALPHQPTVQHHMEVVIRRSSH